MGREGVEPSTSRLSGVRSNHLSYRPNLMCPSRLRDWHFQVGRPRTRALLLPRLCRRSSWWSLPPRRDANSKASPNPAKPHLVEPIGIEPMTY